MVIVLTHSYLIDGDVIGPGEVELTNEQLAQVRQAEKLRLKGQAKARASAEAAAEKATEQPRKEGK